MLLDPPEGPVRRPADLAQELVDLIDHLVGFACLFLQFAAAVRGEVSWLLLEFLDDGLPRAEDGVPGVLDFVDMRPGLAAGVQPLGGHLLTLGLSPGGSEVLVVGGGAVEVAEWVSFLEVNKRIASAAAGLMPADSRVGGSSSASLASSSSLSSTWSLSASFLIVSSAVCEAAFWYLRRRSRTACSASARPVRSATGSGLFGSRFCGVGRPGFVLRAGSARAGRLRGVRRR